MKRQTLLLIVLALVIVVGLPYHYMDGALTVVRTEADEATEQALSLHRQVVQLKRREEALALHAQNLNALRSRLVGSDPFRTIQVELDGAAKASGVTIGSRSMEGAVPVADLPDLQRYAVTIEVSGSRQQFLEFLRMLEQHSLLIELPEVALALPAPSAGQTGSPEVQTTLALNFFGSAGKK